MNVAKINLPRPLLSHRDAFGAKGRESFMVILNIVLITDSLKKY